MNTLRIAWRNTSRQKKRSILLGGAIAFGIMVITLLEGFTGGIILSAGENISQRMAGHVFIYGSEVSRSGQNLKKVSEDALLTEVLEPFKDDILYTTRRSSTRGTLIFGSREISQSISGVNWTAESFFSERLLLNDGTLEGLENPRALILPEKDAARLGMEIGESLLFKLSTVSGQNNVGEFTLIATTADQGSTLGESGYAHLEYVNTLLNLGSDEYQTLNLYLKDNENIDSLSLEIEHTLAEKAKVELRKTEEEEDGGHNLMASMMMMRGPGGPGGRGMFGGGSSGEEAPNAGEISYRITTLNDILEPIMTLINILNQVGMAIYFLLLIITMVGISNTFRMIMIERIGEIGTMRAVGMQKGQVRNLFLTEAAMIALLGAVAGILIALLGMSVLSKISFSNQFGFFLYKGKLKFDVPLLSMLRNIPLLGVLSLLAAWVPAKKAAALKPAVALRTQY
jgi:putative ABC transport system permease protein